MGVLHSVGDWSTLTLGAVLVFVPSFYIIGNMFLGWKLREMRRDPWSFSILLSKALARYSFFHLFLYCIMGGAFSMILFTKDVFSMHFQMNGICSHERMVQNELISYLQWFVLDNIIPFIFTEKPKITSFLILVSKLVQIWMSSLWTITSWLQMTWEFKIKWLHYR